MGGWEGKSRRIRIDAGRVGRRRGTHHEDVVVQAERVVPARARRFRGIEACEHVVKLLAACFRASGDDDADADAFVGVIAKDFDSLDRIVVFTLDAEANLARAAVGCCRIQEGAPVAHRVGAHALARHQDAQRGAIGRRGRIVVVADPARSARAPLPRAEPAQLAPAVDGGPTPRRSEERQDGGRMHVQDRRPPRRRRHRRARSSQASRAPR